MKRSIWPLAALAMFALGCAPEYEEKAIEGGQLRYAVGICAAEEGREPERACSEAAQCQSFCCECESGTKFTAAVCNLQEGCQGFGDACRLGEPAVCE